MIIFVLALAIVGMAYNPVKSYLSFGNYTDLYRIFNELSLFRTYGWHVDQNLMGLTTMTTNYSAVVLAKSYMYLFAMSSSNDHLIVFVNTLLTYGSIALSISLLGKRIKTTNLSELSIFVFFVLINDYSRVIANIRMPLATALFALIWSFEISHNVKKRWVYPLYCSLCLFHNAMYLFLVIKLLVDVLSERSSKLFLPIMLLSSMLLNPIISILSRLSGLGVVVSGLLQKVLLYSESDTKVGVDALAANSRLVVINLLRISYFLLVIYMAERSLKRNKEMEELLPSYRKVLSFGKLLTAFALGSLWSFHLFNRTVLFMLVLIPIYMIIIVKNHDIHALSIRNTNVFTFATWIITLVSITYYFYGYTYQELIF